MPKLGRFSIGSVRARKKKVEEYPAVDEVSDAMEEEEESSAGPSAPPLDIPSMLAADPVLAARKACSDHMLAEFTELQNIEKEQERLLRNFEHAMHAHEVVNRRWRKTLLHYFNDNPMLRWATPSELKRALGRMQEIDDEHDATEDIVLERDKEKVAHAKWGKLRKQQILFPERGVSDGNVEEAARELAAVRASLGVPRERPERKMDAGQVMELIARHASMAEAFQWMRLSEIRDDY